MPISIADFVNDSAQVEVETKFGPLAVRYRPNAMTPEKEAALARLAEGGADADEDPDLVAARLFCELVEWVDLVGPLSDAEGEELVAADQPVPMAPEVIRCLPSNLLSDIMETVRRHGTAADAPKSPTPSRGGSFSRKGR